MFAALAVHAARSFENVLRVEAAEGSCLQDLVHRVLGDHHPPSRMRDGQRSVNGAIEDPDYPPSRTRTGHEAQARTSHSMLVGAVILARTSASHAARTSPGYLRREGRHFVGPPPPTRLGRSRSLSPSAPPR